MVKSKNDGYASDQRMFVSYSRKDGHRVKGLVEFLRAAKNDVFFDRQILAGQRWSEVLDEEITQADTMVVFWTKSAAGSKYVRKEYLQFLSGKPEGRLFAVVGDTTPLVDELAAHQAVDFLPILNELEVLRKDMEEKKASKAEIRAAIAAKLKDQGLEIKDGAVRRMLGYMGLRGVEGYPSRFIEAVNGYLLETQSKVAVMLALVAVAGTAFGAFAFQEETAPKTPATRIDQRPIALNENGNQACEKAGMICASVEQGWVHELGTGKYYGSTTATCFSRVQKVSTGCGDREYALSGVKFTKSKNAKSSADFSAESRICLKEDKYEFANCVPPLPDPDDVR